VKQAYSLSATSLNANETGLVKKADDVVETLKDLRKTDYFDKVQMKLKKMGNRLSISELIERFKGFDEDKQGRIKIHHFINILKYNYPMLFD
jgi:Ca2+-binding EF-hand superfamily protein